MERKAHQVDLSMDRLIADPGRLAVAANRGEIQALAQSISRFGLVRPILACPSREHEGEYEIVDGLRRFLAHRELKKETIRALVLPEAGPRLFTTPPAVKATLSIDDLADACSALYRKYRSVRLVTEETGLPSDRVLEALEFDHLQEEMRELVRAREVDLSVALRAQNVVTGHHEYDPLEAVALARDEQRSIGVGIIAQQIHSCAFCTRILAGNYSEGNSHCVAFQDAFPVSPGHTLVLPRRHVRRLDELDELEIGSMHALAIKVRRMLDTDRAPDGYNIGFNDGAAAGQTIDHVHLHVIPRFVGDQDDPRGGIRWVIPDRARYWED